MTRSLLPEATFQRPVKATLHVHLANGEMFQATADDLAQFGLVGSLDAYMRFDEALDKILREAGLVDGDITDAALNPLRYLVETAICHPHLLNHPEHHGWANVAAIERALQALLAARESLPPLPWTGVDRDGDPSMVEHYRDAAGEEVSFDNLVVRHALVDVVNASTDLEGS